MFLSNYFALECTTVHVADLCMISDLCMSLVATVTNSSGNYSVVQENCGSGLDTIVSTENASLIVGLVIVFVCVR